MAFVVLHHRNPSPRCVTVVQSPPPTETPSDSGHTGLRVTVSDLVWLAVADVNVAERLDAAEVLLEVVTLSERPVLKVRDILAVSILIVIVRLALETLGVAERPAVADELADGLSDHVKLLVADWLHDIVALRLTDDRVSEGKTEELIDSIRVSEVVSDIDCVEILDLVPLGLRLDTVRDEVKLLEAGVEWDALPRVRVPDLDPRLDADSERDSGLDDDELADNRRRLSEAVTLAPSRLRELLRDGGVVADSVLLYTARMRITRSALNGTSQIEDPSNTPPLNWPLTGE